MDIEKLIKQTTIIYLNIQQLNFLIKSTLENDRLDTFVKRVTLSLLDEPLENLKLQLDLLIDLHNCKSDEERLKAVKLFSSKLDNSTYQNLLSMRELCSRN